MLAAANARATSGAKRLECQSASTALVPSQEGYLGAMTCHAAPAVDARRAEA